MKTTSFVSINKNHLDAAILLTNSSRNPALTIDYSPFGEATEIHMMNWKWMAALLFAASISLFTACFEDDWQSASPPNENTMDAGYAAQDAENTNSPDSGIQEVILPTEDPKCPAIKLQESASAVIGPEGGKIKLSFSDLHFNKNVLEKKTHITFARYGIGEFPSKYDYYRLEPEGLFLKRHFSIGILVRDAQHRDIFDNVHFVYLDGERKAWKKTEILRMAEAGETTVASPIAATGFFKQFKRIGLRVWESDWDECPEQGTKSVQRGSGTGTSQMGKCFDAEYTLDTTNCGEAFGAICHQGLAGNSLSAGNQYSCGRFDDRKMCRLSVGGSGISMDCSCANG